MFKRRKNEIIKRFYHKELICGPSPANCFGVQSKGVTQIRGNGLLVLTSEELFFGMYFPQKDFLIPTDLIYKIETSKTHLGKTKFTDLLKVNFTNNEGKNDSIAWWVTDLKLWINTLENVIKSS